MPKVSNFVYCLEAKREEDSTNKRLNANGIFSTLILDFMPSNFSFSIVFSVIDVDFDEDNKIRVCFKKKNEKAFIIDTGDIKITLEESLDPVFGVDVSFDFRNVAFQEEGDYESKIYLNGEEVYLAPLRVQKRKYE